jgi:hypothetical protein
MVYAEVVLGCRNPSFGLATKAKGLQGCGPKGRKPGSQGKEAARVRTKRKPESHITYSRECEKVWGSVREWTLTLPRQLPLWEMESRWTPKISKSDFRGLNSMDCAVIYIIGKLLKHRRLKWARIAHLDIWNTSYDQKKGRESNWQFDSRSQKVGKQPLPDIRFESTTRRWKALDESYNFASDLVLIGLCSREIWASKVPGLQPGTVSGLQLGSPGKNSHLDVTSVTSCRVYYKGEGGGFLQVRAVVSLVCPCCPCLVLAPRVLQLCINHLVWVVCRPVWVSEACQLFLVPS